MTERELKEARAYATRRASETGYAYVVSSFGRVVLSCPHNLRFLADLREEVVYTAEARG